MARNYSGMDDIILRLIAWNRLYDWNVPVKLSELLGYPNIYAMQAGWCDKDVEVLQRLTGPNGYFYYRVWRARGGYEEAL